MELMTTETVVRYINEMREALDDSNVDLVNMLLDLLSDIAIGDDEIEMENRIYECDICGDATEPHLLTEVSEYVDACEHCVDFAMSNVLG